mmetsp:Transcript_132255/g.423112  ORF Transcript_132255/g.423112 Transcript_132255/m.423112 type:complete len:95 (+) Transcript_132255:321-605(+)
MLGLEPVEAEEPNERRDLLRSGVFMPVGDISFGVVGADGSEFRSTARCCTRTAVRNLSRPSPGHADSSHPSCEWQLPQLAKGVDKKPRDVGAGP